MIELSTRTRISKVAISEDAQIFHIELMLTAIRCRRAVRMANATFTIIASLNECALWVNVVQDRVA